MRLHYCTAMKKLIVVVPFLSVFVLCAFLPCTIFMCGCDLAKPQNEGQRPPPVVMEDVPQDQPAQNEPVPKEDDTVTVKAEVGMTGKGNYSSANADNPMGIITVPVKTLFTTQQRLVLQQITAAENLYKGEHEKLPSSNEEYMEKIIRANNIQLPRLPAGQTYEFDPTDNELKIRKPRDAQ